ncbi:MAG: T9SS type A sorting domain-containing protein [FCB group bacterium]|nr:T9SS type A sorting domain-containing protein [FCB group bacterium]MBL7028287.1 T9SS type A sorting domain-containing protein [Candidatus Neomarinimicrobiota bacterium]MBL7121606.1 T9SS type A sorting domain-containing protein [Candidatus Neomarinimicrobiota bacterium]
MNHKSGRSYIYIGLLFVLLNSVFAENRESNSLSKASTLEFGLLDGNQIRNWIGNNGHLVSHIPTGDSGLEWPTGTGLTSVFASGIWVMGMVDGDLRSAAAEFSSEWGPGTIPYDTETQQPISDVPLNTPDEQVYIIERNNSSDIESPQYNREYATWPASDGALAHDGEHFEDLNGNGLWENNETFEDFDLDGSYDAPDGVFVTGEDPPVFEGDQMAWYATNDWNASAHANLFGTQRLGLEAHVLITSKDENSPIGNVQFHTITLINKGGQTISDAYYTYWCDADVGDANDDYVGCDPPSNLGYFYNGDQIDQDYGSRPPAVGYAILQGPMVTSLGDTTFYGGETYPDKTLLNMTAFNSFTNSDSQFGDPENAEEAYNLMQGLTAQGDPWHEYLDENQPITTFLYPGDPETGTGWTEQGGSAPGDRRALMSMGPFTMAPWVDTNGNGKAEFGEPGVQVIHSALAIGAGTNNLNAISAMKYFMDTARDNFDEPGNTAPAIIFTGSGYDQEIVLNWFEGAAEYEAVDWQYFGLMGYDFEGYELYQGETAEGPWSNIGTFDVVNDVGIIMEQYFDPITGTIQNRIAHFGNNSGLEHIVYIREDAFNSGAALVNGQDYHFAFSAYFYDNSSNPPSIETQLQIVSVQPHQFGGGIVPRDTLSIIHTGSAEASITVDVLDPSHLSGHAYEIYFTYDSTAQQGSWHLKQDPGGSSETLLSSGESGDQFYVDGFELTIADILFEAPRFNASWEQTSNIQGDYHETLELLAVSPGGVDSLAWTDASMTTMVHMDTLYGAGYAYDYFELEDRGLDTWFILHRVIQHQVFIQGFASQFGAQDGDRVADIPGIGGGSTDALSLQGNLELRFTDSGQSASLWRGSDNYVPHMINIPFEVWDVEQNIQLCVGIMDNNNTGGIQDTSLPNWETSLDLDWVVVFYEDDTTHTDSLQELFNNPHSGWCWQFTNTSEFSAGDVVSLNFMNPVIAGTDVYTWTTAGTSAADDPESPQEFELKQLAVYPNPFNPSTTIHYRIPEQADVAIRIYDLLGREIWSREISGNPAGYQSLQWNGLKKSGNQAASGVYLITLSTSEFRLVQKALLIR